MRAVKAKSYAVTSSRRRIFNSFSATTSSLTLRTKTFSSHSKSILSTHSILITTYSTIYFLFSPKILFPPFLIHKIGSITTTARCPSSITRNIPSHSTYLKNRSFHSSFFGNYSFIINYHCLILLLPIIFTSLTLT
jgi:hypothetical protein